MMRGGDPETMKISDMELFLQMVQEESLNKVAEKNYMTEAAVSQQLKKMEQETGCSLFYRKKGKKLELSEEGNRFRKSAEMIVEEYHRFLDDTRKNKVIKIGVSIRQSETAVQVLKTMAEDFSLFRYSFVETGHLEREEMVKLGKLDLAYTSFPLEVSGLGYTIVQHLPIGIFLRAGHPFSQRTYKKEGEKIPYINLDDLKQEPLMLPGQSMPHQRSLAIQILKKYHIKPDTQRTFQTLNYGRMMAEEGICSAISIATDFREEIPKNFYLIDGCDITYDMALVYRKENEKDPDIRRVIGYFKRYFEIEHC